MSINALEDIVNKKCRPWDGQSRGTMQCRCSCQNSCSIHNYVVPMLCVHMYCTHSLWLYSCLVDRLEHRIHPGDTTHTHTRYTGHTRQSQMLSSGSPTKNTIQEVLFDNCFRIVALLYLLAKKTNSFCSCWVTHTCLSFFRPASSWIGPNHMNYNEIVDSEFYCTWCVTVTCMPNKLRNPWKLDKANLLVS